MKEGLQVLLRGGAADVLLFGLGGFVVRRAGVLEEETEPNA